MGYRAKVRKAVQRVSNALGHRGQSLKDWSAGKKFSRSRMAKEVKAYRAKHPGRTKKLVKDMLGYTK